MSDDDTLDLAEGVTLSSSAPIGTFVRAIYTPGVGAPIGHTRVANFGDATHRGRNVTAYVIGDRDAFESRRGRRSTAITEADLVAWLLTNREELLRLAAIGQAVEAASPGAATEGREVGRG